MREKCPLYNEKKQCPIETDIIELAGKPCETNKHGNEICGPIAAYGVLEGYYDGLEELDNIFQIVGSFKIETVPEGLPPLEIREHWVGVELPVRHPDRLQTGDFIVSPADAVLSLLSHGKLDAADWFFKTELELGPFLEDWGFRANEGSFTKCEPIKSKDYYGNRLDPETRKSMEKSFETEK